MKSVASGAIVEEYDDVTVRGLVVEKLAKVQAQRGAIMAIRIASTVSILGAVGRSRATRSPGPSGSRRLGTARTSSTTRSCGTVVQDVGGRSGPDAVVERDEIAHDVGRLRLAVEAGGRVRRCDELVVRDHVHHDEGPGLWTDIDNIHTLYEGDLVEYDATSRSPRGSARRDRPNRSRWSTASRSVRPVRVRLRGGHPR